MRYSITINQLAIVTNNLDLSIEEVIILDYLYWLCKSDNLKLHRIIIDNEEYTWFDYGYFIKQNPLLQNKWKSKSSLTTKLKILEDKNFIKTKLSGEYIQKKYILVLPKIEIMYGDDDTKRKNKKNIEKERCDWCNNNNLPIEEHHYPIPEIKGGKKIVRICSNCHSFFHETDKNLSPEERKKITVQKSKQYTVSETKQVSFRKLNVDNNNINNNNNNKEKNIIKKEKYPLSAITEDDISQIAIQYHTSIGYVKLQLEKLRNYAPNKKGKPYSDYKAALRNFVLLSMERAIEKKQEDKYAPIDARNVK